MSVLTMFTACNRTYEPFVLPYALSALFHNDDTVVEICVENPERFRARNREVLSLLRKQFPDRMLVREGRFSRRLPNSVRFLESPRLQSEYTYIGDADVIILDRDICRQHLEHMQRTGLPYSNVIRPGTQRLTGLHFTRPDVHYPLDLPIGLDIGGSDEHLLYRIVVNKGLPLPDPADRFRPGHGYHLSLNRAPTRSHGKPHWGLSSRYLDAYSALVRSPVWQSMLPHFSPAYRMLLLVLDSALQVQHPDTSIFQTREVAQLFSQLSRVKTDLR